VGVCDDVCGVVRCQFEALFGKFCIVDELSSRFPVSGALEATTVQRYSLEASIAEAYEKSMKI